jgi:hypothetical protein
VRRKGKERKKEKQLQWGSTREVRGKVGETLLRSRRRAGETRAYETIEKERGPGKNRVGKGKKKQKEGGERRGGEMARACKKENRDSGEQRALYDD